MIIGLTGGICSGKSTASEALSRAGAWVVDCDVIAHFLANYDIVVIEEIVQSFGEAVLLRRGGIDRRKLSHLVFADAADRARLEAILHPPILDLVRRTCTYARQRNLHLIVVIPLLFELGVQSEFDETWLVDCEPGLQLERLVMRSGMDKAEAERWIAAQLPLESKRSLAGRVFANNAKIEDLQAAVRSAWEGIAEG